MTYFKNNTLKIISILLVLLSIAIRVVAIPHSNYDMETYNLLWYQTIYQKGIGEALATNFSNYTPPYTYFLALATLAHDLIPPLISIKLIPICFDFLGAFYIYKIGKLKFTEGYLPNIAAAIYLMAPTVILNSAYWGQADSLYTSLLLACLYYFLTDKSFISMLAYGLAFSVKAQAIFLFPFLGIMAIRKRIPWLYFGIIPIVYLAAVLPAALLGRPLLELLLIYTQQSDEYAILSVNAPNPYILFPREWYAFILPIGLIATGILIARWMYTTSQNKTNIDNKYIILIAFISTALTPFLLPKMHDRYFYPADVLSIVLAFYWPSLWFIPLLYQFVSVSAISVFLFNGKSSLVVFGFLLNAIALAIVLRTQRLAKKRDVTNQNIPSALSWFVSFIIPIILFGVSINFLLTPSSIRMEYDMPHIPADQFGFTKSERIQWASQTIDYLTTSKKIQSLARQKFENGLPVFKDHEIDILENIKELTQKSFIFGRISLVGLFILILLAWVGDWLPSFHIGMKRGAWLTVGLAIIIGIAAFIFNGIKPNLFLQNTDTILRLFPIRIWQDSLLFISISMIGSGLLLALGLTKIKNIPLD